MHEKKRASERERVHLQGAERMCEREKHARGEHTKEGRTTQKRRKCASQGKNIKEREGGKRERGR